MARDQKLNVEITADDKASARITDVAKQVDKTDGKKATVKVDADTSSLTDALEDIDGPIGDLAGKANDLAAKFGGKAGVAGGVAAVGVGLLAAADYAADAAIEVGEVAALTGDSVEQASRLNGVWKQAGFDTADLKDVLLQMNGVLRDSPELAGQLGINLDDGKTIGERFTQVVDKLGDGFTESGERAQLASKLFGEEGVRQVSAVQQAFGDLVDAVEEYNGKVYSSEDVREAYQHRQDVAKLKQEWSDAVVTVGQYALKIAKFSENAFLAPARFFESLAGGYNAFDTSATVAEIEDAERAAQMFDRSILASATSFDEVHAMVMQVTGSLHAANLVAAEWANANREAGEAMSPAADMIAESIDKARASVELARTNVERFGDDGVEQMGRVEEATDDATDEVDRFRNTISRLRGELSAERAFVQLSEDLYAAGGNAAITRGEVLGLQDQVLDYIEQVEDVPTNVVTDILTLIDEGKYGEALAMLAELEKERNTWVNIRPRVITGNGNTRVRMDEFGNLQSFDTGGVVAGPKGSPQLVVAHAGETILPTHKTPSTPTGRNRDGLIHIENYNDHSGVGPREFARMLNARLLMGG